MQNRDLDAHRLDFIWQNVLLEINIVDEMAIVQMKFGERESTIKSQP